MSDKTFISNFLRLYAFYFLSENRQNHNVILQKRRYFGSLWSWIFSCQRLGYTCTSRDVHEDGEDWDRMGPMGFSWEWE